MTESTALSVRAAGTATVTYRMGGTDVPLIRDPQCRVCNSPHRFDAEEKIIEGVAFKKINDRLPQGAEPFSDSSLRRHWKNHMAVEQAVARDIVERRAMQVGKRISDAEETLIDGITLMQVVVQKTFERIARGELEPNLREGLAAAKGLADLGEYDDGALDQQAYVEAFSIYQAEARAQMGDEGFAAFGEALAKSPVLAALMARYHGEAPEPEPEAAEGTVSEDS